MTIGEIPQRRPILLTILSGEKSGLVQRANGKRFLSADWGFAYCVQLGYVEYSADGTRD